MVFSSLEFIFIFLPIFFVIYLSVDSIYKNLVLLISSILFYGYGALKHPPYILIIIISIAVNYFLGKQIATNPRYKKSFLILGMILNFGCLIVFKYFGFLLSIVSSLFEVPDSIIQMPIFNLQLPVGISFYTFQAASYLVDVYRGNTEYEESFVDFGAYICMFPQLIAGPIVTYSEVKDRLKARICNIYTMSDGLKTFIFGLGLKVIIANRVGNLWTTIGNLGFESISTQLAWLAIISRTFQIYFDFFGYSLMAVGLGQMIGFKFPANFDHPYLTLSMTEFWRKWHITLGRWFREYVYIPLGGNRKGDLITYRNLFIVWTLTGLWHGANINFLLWGLSLFFFIALEKFALNKVFKNRKMLARIYMLLLIPTTWVLFSITDLHSIIVFYKKLFPFLGNVGKGIYIYQNDYIKYLSQSWFYILLGFIFSTRFPYRIYAKIKNSTIGLAFLFIVFWYSIYSLYMGLNDIFLYFRF